MAVLELNQTTLGTDSALVSYWNFDGSNSNDSKDSNNGTDTSITYSAANGKFGVGAGFDGGTSKIVIPDATNLKITGAFSVMAFVKGTATSAGDIFQCYSQNSNVAGYRLEIPSGTTYYTVSGKNTGVTSGVDYVDLMGTKTLNDNAFHMIVATYDGTNLRLYSDGTLDSTSATWTGGQAYAGTNYIRIGVRNNAGSDMASFFYNGAADDIAVFNRALGSAEINNHWLGNDALPTSGIAGWRSLMGVGN